MYVVIGDHDKNDDSEVVSKRIKGRPIPHPSYELIDKDVAVIRFIS